MVELIETIAKALVDNPDQVKVRKIEKDYVTVIKLNVASEDMGKVIGKQGRIAKAIRSVLKAATANEKKRVVLDIEE